MKIEETVSKGCPQGSCSGPGFWNIQYNSLFNVKFRKQTKVIAFADDLLVLTKGKYLVEAENYANTEMIKITKWAKNNKIQFNEQKSKAMIITRKRTINENGIKIYLNNKILEETQEIKYLGIFLDSKFTFKKHISYTTEKCLKLINILARSAKINWG